MTHVWKERRVINSGPGRSLCLSPSGDLRSFRRHPLEGHPNSHSRPSPPPEVQPVATRRSRPAHQRALARQEKLRGSPRFSRDHDADPREKPAFWRQGWCGHHLPIRALSSESILAAVSQGQGDGPSKAAQPRPEGRLLGATGQAAVPLSSVTGRYQGPLL